MKRAARGIATVFGVAVFLYGLLFAVTERLPDPPTSTCNCVGKGPDCYEQDFQYPDGLDAHCAFYGVRANCCEYTNR